jgi:CheY-like chemotaxis protein
MNDQPSRTVLLVDFDAEERECLSEALEESGFQVLGCPGPSSPDYTCIGGREGRCPLVEQVDAVVLDLWTRGDEPGVGTSAEELLELYVAAGRPVVSLGPGGWLADPTAEECVVRLEAHPDAQAVVEAVNALPSATGFVQHG